MARLPQIAYERSISSTPRTSVSGEERIAPYRQMAAGLGAAAGSLEDVAVDLAASEGASAVYRDEEGTLRVRQRFPFGRAASAYNRAAQTAFGVRLEGDIQRRAFEMRQESESDPGVFESSWKEYADALASEVPRELRGMARTMLEREGARQLQGIVVQNHDRDIKVMQADITAAADAKQNEILALARRHGVDSGEFTEAVEDYDALLGEMVGNPEFTYSQEQHDLAMQDLAGRSAAEGILGEIERVVDEGDFEAARRMIEAGLSDPSIDLTPEQRRAFTNLAEGRLNELGEENVAARIDSGSFFGVGEPVQPSSSGRTIAYGDSIAVGIAGATEAEELAEVGAGIANGNLPPLDDIREGDRVVVSVGLNDAPNITSEEARLEYREQVRDLIRSIRERGGDPVLMGIGVEEGANLDPDAVRRTNQALQEAATATETPFVEAPATGRGADGVHFADYGRLAGPLMIGDTAAGVAPTENRYLETLRGAESGGDDRAENPGSSASGRYQFTRGTWEGLGFDWADRFDPDLQEEAIRRFTASNASAFRERFGREMTDAEAYAMHLFGRGGGLSVMSQPPDTPMAAVFPPGAQGGEHPVIAGNAPLLRGKTVGEVMAGFERRFGDGRTWAVGIQETGPAPLAVASGSVASRARARAGAARAGAAEPGIEALRADPVYQALPLAMRNRMDARQRQRATFDTSVFDERYGDHIDNIEAFGTGLEDFDVGAEAGGLYTPAEVAELEAREAQAFEDYTSLQVIRHDPLEMAAVTLTEAAPVPGTADIAGQVERYGRFLEAYDQRLDATVSLRGSGAFDPAGYVRQGSRELQSAYGEAITTSDPLAWDHAMRVSLMAQERLGVAPEDRRVLPAEIAEQQAANLMSLPTGGERLQMIHEMDALYGPHFDQAIGEITAAGLDASTELAVMVRDNPADARLAASVIGVDPADLQRGLGDINVQQEILTPVEEELAPFMRAFEAGNPSVGNLTGSNRIVEAVQNVALQAYRETRSASDAVERATSMITDNINVIESGNAQLLAPTTLDLNGRRVSLDAGEIERSLDARQTGRAIRDFGPLPITDNPFAEPTEASDMLNLGSTISTAVNSGVWMTNAAGDGAVLMVPFSGGGYVPLVNAEGARYQVTWEEMKRNPAVAELVAPTLRFGGDVIGIPGASDLADILPNEAVIEMGRRVLDFGGRFIGIPGAEDAADALGAELERRSATPTEGDVP